MKMHYVALAAALMAVAACGEKRSDEAATNAPATDAMAGNDAATTDAAAGTDAMATGNDAMAGAARMAPDAMAAGNDAMATGGELPDEQRTPVGPGTAGSTTGGTAGNTTK